MMTTEMQRAYLMGYEDGFARRSPDTSQVKSLGMGTCHEVAGMEDMFECSACGMRFEGWALKRWARYCPNCGRKVVEQ